EDRARKRRSMGCHFSPLSRWALRTYPILAHSRKKRAAYSLLRNPVMCMPCLAGSLPECRLRDIYFSEMGSPTLLVLARPKLHGFWVVLNSRVITRFEF